MHMLASVHQLKDSHESLALVQKGDILHMVAEVEVIPHTPAHGAIGDINSAPCICCFDGHSEFLL